MQGVVAVAQRSVEGALVSSRGSFNIRNLSTLTGMSEFGWISYFFVTELQCTSSMQCYCSSTMQHDERGCNEDVLLEGWTSSNTDAEGATVQM